MKVKWIFIACVYCLMVMATSGMSSVEAAQKVTDFELEIELKNNTEFEIEYEVENNKVEAKYKVPSSATKYGQDAQAMIEPFLKELHLTPDTNKEDLKKQILEILQVNSANVNEFELEVEFANGDKLKINQ